MQERDSLKIPFQNKDVRERQTLPHQIWIMHLYITKQLIFLQIPLSKICNHNKGL